MGRPSGRTGSDPSFAPWSSTAALVTSLLSLLAFTAGYRGLVNPTDLELTLPYGEVQMGLAANPTFHRKPVLLVENLHLYGLSDFHYVFAGTTGFTCYEPVLAGGTALPELREGPVEMSYDGGYNLRNPACLEYPEWNDCMPGNRVRIGDEKNLRRFMRGKSVTWGVSPLQSAADVVTLLSLLGALGIIVFSLYSTPFTRESS